MVVELLIAPLLTVAPLLIIPLLVQLVYQAILALIAPPPPPGISAKRDATVPPARGEEARARRGENNEQVLLALAHTLPHARRNEDPGVFWVISRDGRTEKNRHIPAHMA